MGASAAKRKHPRKKRTDPGGGLRCWPFGSKRTPAEKREKKTLTLEKKEEKEADAAKEEKAGWSPRKTKMFR